MAVITLLDSITRGLQPNGNYPKLGSLELDATLSENYNLKSNVTRAPIETGESVTDHIYNEPLSITLECSVSGAHPKHNNNTIAHTQAYEVLKQIRANRQPLNIQTSLNAYPNMVIDNINIQRDSTTRQQLRFSIDAVQVVTVDSEFSQASEGVGRYGRQQGTQANDAQAERLQRKAQTLSEVYA